MGKKAAARVTRRSVESLDVLGNSVLPMSYKMSAYAKLGLLHELIDGVDADAPSPVDIECVRASLAAADAKRTRAASIEVRRRRIREQWNA